jgi:4-hydroxy-tetrahydrodipicolinate reductase
MPFCVTGMNIALLGHGNMGKEIERLIGLAGVHDATVIAIDESNGAIDNSKLKTADVVIDFTSPEIVMNDILEVAKAGKNLVVGTTGWQEHLPEVEQIVRDSGIGLIYGQNFSVGANIFFRAVAHATKLFSAFNEYDVAGLEIHHTGKKDSPSGTAMRAAEEILKNSAVKKTLQTGRLDRRIRPDELHFASVRAGVNPGFHEVVFDSTADAVTISHAAHNREGFAKGAILAAEFIQGKKGLFTFDDVLKARGIA